MSEQARRRVLASAEALGFAPNRLARALATARSQTMGVVVHDVSDPYYAGIIRGLEEVAIPNDHALFVSSSDRDPDKELGVLRSFVANQVDAIVLAGSGLSVPGHLSEVSRVLSRFEEMGGVVVLTSEQQYPAPTIEFDNEGAVGMVVRHLLQLGHRHIAYLSGPAVLDVSRVRLRGYMAAMEGVAHDRGLVETAGFTMEEGERAMAAVLARAEPTAVVAANDLVAIGAERLLLDRGLSVPHDVSVAGIDDIDFAAYAPVPLTTVRVPLRELGRKGARLALDLLAGREWQPPEGVQAELVVRGSTGAAR